MALPYDLTEDVLADVNHVQDNFNYLESKTAVSEYFAKDTTTSTGLTWGFLGGKYRNDNEIVTIATGTVTLTPSATNYIEINTTTDAVVVNTSGFTSGNIPLWQISTGVTGVSGTPSDVRTSLALGGGGATYDADETSLTKSGTTFSIKDGGATDTKIGNRTADEATAHNSLTGTLTQLLSRLFKAIKAITGESSSLTAPATTLAATATHIAATKPHTAHFDVDGGKPLTGDADAGGNRWTNIADPVDDTDAVNKQFAVALVNNLVPKLSVLVATDSNHGLSGLADVNGVAIAAGDRILVWKQTTSSENGIWVAASGAWSRASDANSAAELDAGANVFTQQGNQWKNFRFTQIQTITTLGTDPVVWTESQGAGGSGESNTGANIGSGDAEYFKQKSGVSLQFRTPVSDNNLLTIETDGDNVRYAVNAENLDLTTAGTGALPATKGGTGQSAVAVADILYGSATNVWSRLAGNATATNKFLRCVSGVLSWVGIEPNDYGLFTQSARGAVPPGDNLGSDYFLCATGGFAQPVLNSARLSRGSTTSNTIASSGNKTFNVGSANFGPGQWVKASYNGDPDGVWMYGQVQSYSSPNVVIGVEESSGAGTYANWTVAVVGPKGDTGAGVSGNVLELADIAEPATTTNKVYFVSGALKAVGKFLARWNGDVPTSAAFTTVNSSGLLTASTITGIASQAEAEAGVSATVLMTPERTAEAIAALAESADGASTRNTITQAGHGFTVKKWLRWDETGNTYVVAQADSAANAEVRGMVVEVVDANNFVLCTGGYVDGLSGCTEGVNFLSPSSAGDMTATEPSTAGQISKPVFYAVSATAGYVDIQRGVVVGDALTINSTDIDDSTSTGRSILTGNAAAGRTALELNAWYGDGSDGDATISGTTSLARDTYYDDLTISSGGILQPSGFRVFVRGTLHVQSGGTIRFNGATGNNASGATGGGASSTSGNNMLGGNAAGGAGATGTTGAGAQAASPTAVFHAGSTGSTGGAGGASGATSGGAARAGATNTGYSPRHLAMWFMFYASSAFNILRGGNASAGGGAGAGDGTNAGGGGGGGGASGGFLGIWARIVNNEGAIESKGGLGGNGAGGVAGNAGGGGSGAGGPGGFIYMVTETLTALGTVDVAGGAGGTAGSGSGTGSAGTAGSAGSTGRYIVLRGSTGETLGSNF